MTKKIINTKPTVIKRLYNYIPLFGSIVGMLGLICIILAIINYCEKLQTNISIKDSIFQEIQFARDSIDYTLTQRRLNIRNRVTFNLTYEGQIPETFKDNISLKNELIKLYQSLSSAKKSAEELMYLLSENNSNPQTIQNRENDIKRAIELADKVGPKLAEYVDKTWTIPPPNLTLQQKIKYYEIERSIIYTAATDEQVEIKFHKKPK